MLTTRTLLSVGALLTSSGVSANLFAPRQTSVAELNQDSNILIPSNNTITLKETTLIVTVTRDDNAVDPYTTTLLSTVPAQETVVSGTPTTLAPSVTEVPTVLKAPPATVFTSAVHAASATCAPPAPSSGAALNPASDLTYGCKPGFVCAAKKPAGCNFFTGPPAPNFVCPAEDCVAAPPFVPVRWTENTTGQYPPLDPYYNLNPAEFGLSPSIFDYDLSVEDLDGQIYTFSTGDWGTKTASDAPLPTLGVRRPIPVGRKVGNWQRKPWMKNMEKHLLHARQAFEVAPAICYGPCNDAYREALAVGKTPDICKEESAYKTLLTGCTTCIQGNSATGNSTKIEEKITPSNAFSQFTDYCSSIGAVEGTSGGNGPQSQLGDPTNPQQSTQGVEGNTNGTAVPINPRPTSTGGSATPTSSRPGGTGSGGASSTRPGTSPTPTGPKQAAADTIRASSLFAFALPLFGAFLFI